MRRAAKVDRNHAEIVAALRKVGAHVTSLAACGDGVPDLLVGYRSRLHCIEVKDGAKSPSQRALTADQVRWHEAATRVGVTPHVVETVDDALKAIGAMA